MLINCQCQICIYTAPRSWGGVVLLLRSTDILTSISPFVSSQLGSSKNAGLVTPLYTEPYLHIRSSNNDIFSDIAIIGRSYSKEKRGMETRTPINGSYKTAPICRSCDIEGNSSIWDPSGCLGPICSCNKFDPSSENTVRQLVSLKYNIILIGTFIRLTYQR